MTVAEQWVEHWHKSRFPEDVSKASALEVLQLILKFVKEPDPGTPGHQPIDATINVAVVRRALELVRDRYCLKHRAGDHCDGVTSCYSGDHDWNQPEFQPAPKQLELPLEKLKFTLPPTKEKNHEENVRHVVRNDVVFVAVLPEVRSSGRQRRDV